MDDVDVPLKIKQLILGHSAHDITSKVYTHKTLEQLIAAINSILIYRLCVGYEQKRPNSHTLLSYVTAEKPYRDDSATLKFC